MKVAINGAGIAGTALAYWLSKLGHEVLLVERAPELRSGGFVVNLWGCCRGCWNCSTKPTNCEWWTGWGEPVAATLPVSC